MAFFFALCLENFEDQVLLAEAAGSGNFKSARDATEFSNVLFFEFCDGHESPEVSFRGGILKQEGSSWCGDAGIILAGKQRRWEATPTEEYTPAARRPGLSGATLLVLRDRERFLTRNGGCRCRACCPEADQHIVHRILQPRVRLMQLASRLGGEQAKLVTIADMSECTKNQF
jgi:hypothetical protein